MAPNTFNSHGDHSNESSQELLNQLNGKAKDLFQSALKSECLPERELSEIMRECRKPGLEGDAGTMFGLTLVDRRIFEMHALEEYYLGKRKLDQLFGFPLDQYAAREVVAEGGMGEVRRCMDAFGRDVAVKLPKKIDDPAMSERQVREIFISEDLGRKCPEYFPRVYHFSASTGGKGLYMVMDLLRGDTLQKRIKKQGPAGDSAAIRYLRSIARGIAAAHDCGYVHRDLKPENILLVNGISVRIIDCGLAKINVEKLHAYDHAHNIEDRNLIERMNDAKVGGELILRQGFHPESTQQGTILGSPSYIPPEQAIDIRNADERSDAYGLGGILWYLKTGKVPYPEAGNSPMKHIHEHIAHGLPPADQLPRDTSPLIRAIYEKLRSKNQQERSTVAEVLPLIEKAYEELCGPADRLVKKNVESKRRHVVCALAAALGVAGAAGLYVVSQGGGKKEGNGKVPVAQMKEGGSDGKVEAPPPQPEKKFEEMTEGEKQKFVDEISKIALGIPELIQKEDGTYEKVMFRLCGLKSNDKEKEVVLGDPRNSVIKEIKSKDGGTIIVGMSVMDQNPEDLAEVLAPFKKAGVPILQEDYHKPTDRYVYFIRKGDKIMATLLQTFVGYRLDGGGENIAALYPWRKDKAGELPGGTLPFRNFLAGEILSPALIASSDFPDVKPIGDYRSMDHNGNVKALWISLGGTVQ